MTKLTGDEVLDFEEQWVPGDLPKGEAIRERFGVSPSTYYLALNRAIDDPEAILGRPVTVGRLRRLREARLGERS